ncbi:MAG: hypothetical protein K2M86_07835, partial [Odoribacter sp.]|nr:hypothetical protein [Odoribacter sp.]
WGIVLTACSNDEEEDGIAGTCWEGSHLVGMIQYDNGQPTEVTRTGFLSFRFAEDGERCSVTTSVSGLDATNVITLYYIYIPETHSVILNTSSEESSTTKYHGVIEGNCMEVSWFAGEELVEMKLFRQ